MVDAAITPAHSGKAPVRVRHWVKCSPRLISEWAKKHWQQVSLEVIGRGTDGGTVTGRVKMESAQSDRRADKGQGYPCHAAASRDMGPCLLLDVTRGQHQGSSLPLVAPGALSRDLEVTSRVDAAMQAASFGQDLGQPFRRDPLQ